MLRGWFLIVMLVFCGPAMAEEQEGEMVEYQFVQLMRADGELDVASPQEGRKVQRQHVEFLQALSDDGRALAAGPIVGTGDLRGVLILDVGSVEAAEELMAEDPWIVHGMFRAEIHPWWAAEGILQKPPVFLDIAPTTLGLLKRPADAPEFAAEELARLQQGHLANMEVMHEAGDLVIAGPMGDDTTLRGILLFRTTDREHLLEIIGKDPSIQANRLEVELLEWHIPRGTLPAVSGE